MACKLPLNKPLPNAIRNKATQVRVNNQVVFCDVARIGTDRIMYPIAITTRPVLIIHNDTLNYSFEVEINDFANSWYLHVNDSKSDYRIELGRRPFQVNENIKTDYIYVSSSNEIESPNDHILFNNSQKMVYYRNVKTNVETAKPFTSLSFIKNMGKIYEIYDLYQELYKNEENIEDLTNPSSHTSSQFK